MYRIATDYPRMQEQVGIATTVMNKVCKYMDYRHGNESEPNMGNAAVLLGRTQWYAIQCCSGALPLSGTPDAAKLYDIKVIVVAQSEMLCVVEDFEFPTKPDPTICDCYYKLEA